MNYLSNSDFKTLKKEFNSSALDLVNDSRISFDNSSNGKTISRFEEDDFVIEGSTFDFKIDLFIEAEEGCIKNIGIGIDTIVYNNKTEEEYQFTENQLHEIERIVKQDIQF